MQWWTFGFHKIRGNSWISKGAFQRVPQVYQRGWINEIELNGWTILFTQFHKGERGSRFQNGGKWTCAGRCCCDMWLFNERLSKYLKKKEISGKTTLYSFYTGEQVVTCLLIRVICGEGVTQSESTTLNESWPSPTCSPANPVDHFRWKELFTRFTLIDSTVLINLGDPCKRALRTGSFSRTLLQVVSYLVSYLVQYTISQVVVRKIKNHFISKITQRVALH